MRPLALVLVALALAPAAFAQQAEPGLRIVAEEPRIAMRPGDVAHVVLLVENGFPRDVIAHLAASVSDPTMMKAEPERAELPLKEGASQRVRVRVQVAADAAASEQTITLTASTKGGASSSAEVRVLVDPAASPRPDRVFALEAPRLAIVEAGNATHVDITLRNLRDAPASAVLAARAPPGVAATFSPAVVELPPGGAVTVRLTLDAATGARLGDFPVELRAHHPTLPDAGGITNMGLRVQVAAPQPPGVEHEAEAAAAFEVPRAAWIAAGSVAAVGASAAALVWAWRREGAAVLLAPLYTRIARNRVLDQPTRERIAGEVRAAPGLTFGELQRRLAIGAGALTHHARVLEEAGVVFSTRSGQERRFFHVGQGRAPPALRPLDERALDELRARGPLRLAELARALGVTKQALHYHVKRLQSEGRIAPADDGALHVVAHEDAAARA